MRAPRVGLLNNAPVLGKHVGLARKPASEHLAIRRLHSHRRQAIQRSASSFSQCFKVRFLAPLSGYLLGGKHPYIHALTIPTSPGHTSPGLQRFESLPEVQFSGFFHLKIARFSDSRPPCLATSESRWSSRDNTDRGAASGTTRGLRSTRRSARRPATAPRRSARPARP